MADVKAPQRWLDRAEPGLPSELLEGLRGCAEDGPSDAQRAHMQESLLRGVAGAAPAAGSALLKLAALTVVAGLAAGGLWWWRARPAPPALVSLPTAQAPSMPEPASAAPPSAPPEPSNTHGAAADAPSARAKAVPRVARIAPRADAAGELELLKRARRALTSTPERSLELASEHARTFGEGSFGQERELLAVEALVKLQRLDEARRRAARFAARYPGSAHLPRLDVLVGPR